MTARPRPWSSAPAAGFAPAAGAAVAAAGGLVLVGWAVGVPGLAAPGLVAAVALVCLGLALHQLAPGDVPPKRRLAGQLLGGAAVVVGAAAPVGRLLAPAAEPGSFGTAPVAGVGIVAAAAALLLLPVPRLGRLSRALAVAAVGVGGFVLVGHLYGVSSPHRAGAVHTGAGLVVLGLGVLAARPSRGIVAALTGDTAGAVVGRRLMAASVALPVVLNGLQLVGGRAGWFDDATGEALAAAVYVAALAGVTAWGAASLARADADRARAEEELRRGEAEFRGAFEDTNVATALTDLGHRFVRVNAAYCRLLGYAEAELLGMTVADVAHPTDVAESLARREPLVAGKQPYFQVEKRYVRRDGRVIWGLTNVALVRDPAGRPRLYVGQVQDVTERKRAEEALGRERALLRALIDSVPDLIFTKDAAGRFDVVNRALLEFVGAAGPDDLVGKTVFDLFPPDQARAFHADDLRVLGGEPLINREEVARDAAGRDSWRLVNKTPLRDAAGAVVGLVGISRDIQDRKDAEAALTVSEGQFLQAQKMEVVGRLAGGIAHDFNNLLTVINGYSDIVLAGLCPGHPQREAVEEVRRAGERAALLTRQLLAFSRKQVVQPAVLDLNAVLAEMERMLRRLIGEDVALAVRPAVGLWPVRADPGQAEQVVMNLAVNARDAMPAGGRLTVETANVTLDESYTSSRPDARPGDHVLLAVSDTGCGMTAEVKARAFEPFFTTKGPDKGTGLGLATVYGIVRQWGGHVGVYSEPGVGTTFKVYLPRDRAAAGPGRSHAGAAAAPRGTETVLLAEDEDGVRALARLLLERSGYAVVEARSGAEALQACERHPGPIDLLVTDVVMPGMGGRETAERLKAVRPGMRVLFLSGYTDDAVVRHGVLDEDVPFLHKPFTPVELAQKVRDVLDRPVGPGEATPPPGRRPTPAP